MNRYKTIKEKCVLDKDITISVAEYESVTAIGTMSDGYKFVGMENNNKCEYCQLDGIEKFKRCKLYIKAREEAKLGF